MMKAAFIGLSCFLGTIALVACSTTGSTGGAGGNQAGATSTTASGAAAGGGGTGGHVSIVWVCDCAYGLVPAYQAEPPDADYDSPCPAHYFCSEYDQGFACLEVGLGCYPGDEGCVDGDNEELQEPVCTFDHGLAPKPTDPKEYWESCHGLALPKCARYPDGHWVCCDPQIPPDQPNGRPAP